MDKIIVLGIGNILISDEGFGVRVVEKLQECYEFPDNVQLLDGGTMGYELLHRLIGIQKLILIDAVNGGAAPGTLFRFSGPEVNAYYRQKVSMHQLGIQEVLAMLEITDNTVPDLLVLGVQPASLEFGLDLSPIIEAAAETVAAQVITQLKDWQIPVAPFPSC